MKYFSIASLVAIVVATVVLAVVYERLSVRKLIEQEEQHHVGLTRIAANILWPQFSAFVSSSTALNNDALKSHPDVARLNRAVLEELSGTRVIKIKIYDLAGRTVFSTEAKQIGEDKSKNAGFLSARDGKPASELTHRNQFSAFEQTVENIDVVSSYIPIYARDSKQVEAVFEIYSDISSLLERIRDTRQTVVLQASAILLALYGVLFFIVKHADSVIKRQGLQRQKDEESLREARNEMVRSEEFHRSLIEYSSDAVLILNADLKVRQATAPLQRVTGEAEINLIGKSLVDYVADPERDTIKRWLAEVISKPDAQTIEFAHTDRTGGTRYLEAVATNKLDHPAIQGLVVNMRDISTRKRAEMEVRRLALFDSLTGLSNRALFTQQLRAEVARSKRFGELSAVLFVDLDRFKRVNDTLGHGAGDALLVEVAARIRQALRSGDVLGRDWEDEIVSNLARMGGDEFTILLPKLRRPENAAIVARRLVELIAKPCDLNGQEVIVTASIGIAICPQDGTSVEELLKNADAAMYHAKKHGKNNYQFFSETQHTTISRSLSMETSLRRALELGEFFLHYQPIVDATTQRIVGCEALIRWNHPALGVVAPAQFIPLAEDCGLIVPIGEWVLRTAYAQAAKWQKAGFNRIVVNVNLASPSFRQPDLANFIHRTIIENGLLPQSVGIEVTESILMENVDVVVRTLQQLKELSVKRSVDDFGTGYSSLSYLSRFPIDTLKIDQSFVGKIESNPDDAKITSAIVALAQILQLEIVAEGVETEYQRAFLMQAGCRYMQGFLFSRPVTAEAFTLMLSQKTVSRVA